ncbi:NmrA-like family protein [Xylariaceae sp. FL0016]|nr:NmrA-like family protein [Xylariaceae sp. FL0016]
MSGKKIITVFGATGNQGGSIVSTFLNDPKLKNGWAVRGVTRDVSKESAKKLSEQGAEVVAADMNDKASLVKAMSGSDTVFAVTNYWENPSIELEEQQGRNLADAAKESGVNHFIWSSLLDIKKLTNGKLPHVYHFDGKAHVEEYVRSLDIPATFFMPGYYMSNITGMQFKPSPPDNARTFSLPISAQSPIPLYDTVDTGKYIKAIVLNKDKLLGQRFLGASTYLTGEQIVDSFKKLYPEDGQTARYFQLSEEMFRGFMKGTPEFIIEEFYENMVLMQDYGYYGGASLDETHKYIDDHLTTLTEHMKASQQFADLK